MTAAVIVMMETYISNTLKLEKNKLRLFLKSIFGGFGGFGLFFNKGKNPFIEHLKIEKKG